MKAGSNDGERRLKVCTVTQPVDAYPAVMRPGGLSVERANYLFKTVRPYVRPRYQDKTCPEPRGREE